MGGTKGPIMIPPEVIDRLKKEQEERERSPAQIPLYTPPDIYPTRKIEDEEPTESSRVVVIEM